MENSTRQIKFRAWDKKQNKIREVEQIVLRDRICWLTKDEVMGDWYGFDDIELQQFTGLKDKNGKEIYSGDLLRHNEGSKSYEVMWNDYGFWELDGVCLGMVMRDNPNGLEIVGNIYEK